MKSEKIIEHVRGISLVARHTAKQRVSYLLKISLDGKRYRKTLFAANERDAQAKAKAVSLFKSHAAQVDKGVYTDATYQYDKADFFAFFAQVIETKNPQSRKAWRTAFRHLKLWHKADKLPFGDIDKAKCYSLRAYLESVSKRGILKNNSANVVIAKFKAALNIATEMDIIPFSPAQTLKALESEDSDIQFLTISELSQLAATEPPPVRGYDKETFRAFCLFQARTGMRPADTLRLVWNDIQSDFQGGYFIDYKPSKTRRKGVRAQRLPLHADIITLLKQHRDRQVNYDSSAQIFTGLPSEHSNAVNVWLRRWCKAAKIQKPLTVYGLRHTFASNTLEQGADIYTISKLLAHTTTAHTQRYSHVLDAEKQRAVYALPSILSS
jgi:integrase/recombinase XerD